MITGAIKATFSDFKLIRGRKVAMLIFEVPIEAADAALDTLGGLPRPDQEAWCGIARIDPKKAASAAPMQSDERVPKERRRFRDVPLAAQAGMRCAEPAFQKFLSEEHASFPITDADTAASFVREHCCVKSRSEIIEGSKAADKWLALNSQYDVWMRGVSA